MEYEIPFIQVLNNDHNNEQSILCRASRHQMGNTYSPEK